MRQNQSDFILLDHTADLGMEVYGTSLSELFEKAAWALLKIMMGGKTRSGPHGTRTISISADDTADLMVRWLSEILFLVDGEGRVVTGIAIKRILPQNIVAVVDARNFDPAHDDICCEIKAITYHQIAVTCEKDRWTARVIFDL